MRLDPDLLNVLACPSCHSQLAEAPGGGSRPGGVSEDELACTGCDLVYPVDDGVPVLLVDRARRARPNSQD